MTAWGKYSNPPSKDSPQLQEIKRLHYLWSEGGGRIVLPLTFKGEASEELLDFLWEKSWVDKQMRNPVPEEWRLKFPSREGWLAMTAAQLKQIAGQLGLSKSGTKLTLYTKILEYMLNNTPSNLYLPLEQLNERVPIFPYSEDAEKISKLYLDTEIAYQNFSQILKYTYFTPETFKEIIKWDEKFPDGILDADKDASMVFGRYFPYYLLTNPHFDLNLLLLRDPAVLYDRHRISAGDNSLAKQLVSGNNTLLGDGTWAKNLLSNNQLLTLELLITIFADYFTTDVVESRFPTISDRGVKDGLKRMVATNEAWGEALVGNPCFPESLIQFLVQTYPDLLEDALQNPNLSSDFIMEVWSDLTFDQMDVLLTHNHFVPRVLIRSLFGIKEDVPKFDSTLTALYMGKWHNYIISGSEGERNRFQLFDKVLRQYHLPLDMLKDIRPNTEDNDYLQYIGDKVNLDADILAKNPNPEILEYALDNFPVFLEGGSPRYAIAQNPSLTKILIDMGNASTVSLLEKHYPDFDADDVAKNPALTKGFIEKYWQNGRTPNDKTYTGLSNHLSDLTSNPAFFPYDPTPEWASGLFNWRF